MLEQLCVLPLQDYLKLGIPKDTKSAISRSKQVDFRGYLKQNNKIMDEDLYDSAAFECLMNGNLEPTQNGHSKVDAEEQIYDDAQALNNMRAAIKLKRVRQKTESDEEGDGNEEEERIVKKPRIISKTRRIEDDEESQDETSPKDSKQDSQTSDEKDQPETGADTEEPPQKDWDEIAEEARQRKEKLSKRAERGPKNTHDEAVQDGLDGEIASLRAIRDEQRVQKAKPKARKEESNDRESGSDERGNGKGKKRSNGKGKNQSQPKNGATKQKKKKGAETEKRKPATLEEVTKGAMHQLKEACQEKTKDILELNPDFEEKIRKGIPLKGDLNFFTYFNELEITENEGEDGEITRPATTEEKHEAICDFMDNVLAWFHAFVPPVMKKAMFSKKPFDLTKDPELAESYDILSFLNFGRLIYARYAQNRDLNLDHYTAHVKKTMKRLKM
jgi:hypothetical protein